MKLSSNRFLLSLTFAIFSFLSLAVLAEDNQDEVKRVFNSYKQSVIHQDGEKALSLVTQGTIDYYSELQKHALSSTKAELEAMSWIDQVTILRIRHELELSELTKLSGSQLFQHAISEGWTDPRNLSSLTIGNIDSSASIAIANILFNGEPSPINYKFRKENEKWKIDLVYLIHVSGPSAEDQINKLAQQQGLTIEEINLRLTEASSGHPIKIDLYQPLLTN